MIRRFIDVGIAVKNLETAMALYSAVLEVPPRILTSKDYAYPGLRGARFYTANATISLVASDYPQTPIACSIETRGEGINHLTLEVTNIEEDMVRLAAKGVEFLTEKPLDFPKGRVIFAHPRSLHGVQIAFVQSKPGIDLLRQQPSTPDG